MKKYCIVNSGYNVPINFFKCGKIKMGAWSVIWKRRLNAKKYKDSVRMTPPQGWERKEVCLCIQSFVKLNKKCLLVDTPHPSPGLDLELIYAEEQ